VVLIIDEAQDLPAELLEQVRLLSNLETTAEADPDRPDRTAELKRMLDDPRLRQLRQRITVRFHLPPLDRAETELYVNCACRWRAATAARPFSPWALRRIFRYAGAFRA